ncbi:MAG: sialate O-acetylesterase [Victivallales bacterium]|nr:sialate O-acetylesterase [Victivallales bacterium]
MKIHIGLFPSIVLPRNHENVSEQLVTGTCRAAGDVTAEVYAEDRKRPRMTLRKCGQAARGRFTARLNGIPCGGPYRIELAVGEEVLTVEDVLVGELWILAGQSNMQGWGLITGRRPNPEPAIHAYYMDDRWAVAEEPIGRVELSRHPAHLKLLNPPVTSRARKYPGGNGAEPGLPFAIERHRQTGVPQGLIACAHGGTTIEMWNPKAKGLGYGSLYGAMVQRVLRNGGRVTGMLWYQGCSDATPERAPRFEQDTLEFFRAVRKDLKAPKLPIVQVQIARTVTARNDDGDAQWTTIRDAQRRMPERLANLMTVTACDLTLDDEIHLDEESHFRLGRRMAEAISTMFREPAALPPPIELDHAALRYHRAKGRSDLLVHYQNVVGELRSAGRPAGFVASAGGRLLEPYRIDLMGSRVILRFTQDIDAFAYGYGQNPYCNIADAAGRALPATALLPLRHGFVRSPYSSQMMLSEPLTGDQAMDKVEYAMSRGLSYAPAANEAPFNCFPDRIKYLDCNGIRFFRTIYRATRNITLSLALGYDGNVKVFVDGIAVFTDEHARNPIIPASHLVPMTWSPGRHEVLIAVAMNHGCTWGVSLALETAPKDQDAIPTEGDA